MCLVKYETRKARAWTKKSYFERTWRRSTVSHLSTNLCIMRLFFFPTHKTVKFLWHLMGVISLLMRYLDARHSRSRALSSLPPLPLRRGTLVTAGHVTTCDTIFFILVGSTNNFVDFNWNGRNAMATRYKPLTSKYAFVNHESYRPFS